MAGTDTTLIVVFRRPISYGTRYPPKKLTSNPAAPTSGSTPETSNESAAEGIHDTRLTPVSASAANRNEDSKEAS